MTKSVSAKRPVGRPAHQGLNYVRGSKTAVGRLDFLRFDPITELVMVYNRLDEEIARQEEIRDGRVVELSLQGKPKAYRPEVHHALFDKQINIAEKLLRYRYGRVPEGDVAKQKEVAALIVNLTKEGDTYVIASDSADEQGMPDEAGVFNDNVTWDEIDNPTPVSIHLSE